MLSRTDALKFVHTSDWFLFFQDAAAKTGMVRCGQLLLRKSSSKGGVIGELQSLNSQLVLAVS